MIQIKMGCWTDPILVRNLVDFGDRSLV